MSTPQAPGFRGQRPTRIAVRAVGLVLLVVALVFLAIGLQDFFSSSDSFEGPHRFAMVLVGILMLGPAGWCLQAGFLGAASRYVAGETMPVVKDSAAYLSDGQGVLGVGRTVGAAPPGPARGPSRGPASTGPYCARCGVRNDDDASFCDSCGAALAH
jgi:hypothetical protein